MDGAGRVPADADNRSDRHESRKTADRRRQGAEHALFRAGIAIVGVERVADPAAVAGAAPEQADLPLNITAAAETNGMARLTQALLTASRVAKLSLPSRTMS